MLWLSRDYKTAVDIDPNSFETLGEMALYSRDDNCIYYQETMVSCGRSQEFRLLHEDYDKVVATDGHYVFEGKWVVEKGGRPIRPPEAK